MERDVEEVFFSILLILFCGPSLVPSFYLISTGKERTVQSVERLHILEDSPAGDCAKVAVFNA
jgi:hypothetical protein